ncbi:hypothetical protein [Streptomyces sp. NPDC086777]|uniref:hypothetical protein n=1 Tax=Streptomyces sp. NPDC086777 TaxID=3154866 RepID=UPI00344E3DB7
MPLSDEVEQQLATGLCVLVVGLRASSAAGTLHWWGRAGGQGPVSDAVMTAWIAAGSAVAGVLAGGAVTGWFTLAAARRQAQSTVDAAARQADAAWEAGRRQADAAWEAGRLQADAQLDVARQTLTAQREVRRAAYAAFLAAIDAGHQRRLDWQRALGTSNRSVSGPASMTASTPSSAAGRSELALARAKSAHSRRDRAAVIWSGSVGAHP